MSIIRHSPLIFLHSSDHIDQRPPLPPGPGPILPPDPPPPSPSPSNSDSMDPSSVSKRSDIPPLTTSSSSFDSFAHHHSSKTMDMEDDPFIYRGRNNQSGDISGGSTSRGRQTAFVSPVTDSLQPLPPSKIDDEDAYLYGSSDSGGPSGGFGGNAAFASRRKPGGPGGGNRNFTDDDYRYGDRGFRDWDSDYRSSSQSGYQSGGGVLDDLRGDFDGERGTPSQRQDRDVTDDIFLPRGGPTLKRQRREDSPPREFGGGFGGGGFRRGPPRDYDRASYDDRGGNYRGNNIKREYGYDDRGGYPGTGANTAPLEQRVDGPPKSTLKNSGSFQPLAPTPFDKSQYPRKGSLRIGNEAELAKSKPAVYELPKIQKKQKAPEEENASQSEKLAQLRMEHAKLEIMINQLQTLIDRTVMKENEIKRNFKGQSLSENKEFVDNMKLRTDAQRKLDEVRRDYEFKDTIIKKMMEPKVGERQEEEEGQRPNQVAPGATDFLSQREEVLEETDDKYEFFDGGEHWCQSCNFFGGSVKEFLEHLQTEDHWKTSSSTKQVAPWPIVRRNPSKAPDRSLIAIKGSQLMIPCKGYYCAICRMFCGDIESGEEHLYSLMHNKSMIKFGITKPEYEFIFNKDKIAAKNKAEAERRKKERDGIEKRNREAEEKRRKEQEEKKRIEREMREKANEENLQRLKEMENKRKEKERRERQRDRETDRDRDRHRKDKIQINDSSASSSDNSDVEVVSRPSRGVAVTIQKAKPEDDPKIKAGCTVAIPYIEARTTRKAFEKMGKKVSYLAKVLVLVENSIEDQKWVSQKSFNKDHQETSGSATLPAASSPSAVCSPSEESQQKSSLSATSQPSKPKIVTEFDGRNDDEFNLTSVTEGKRNASEVKDSSTDKNAEEDKEDSKNSSTADMSNGKDKADRNSQTSGGGGGDKTTYDQIFSAIDKIVSTEREGAGEETPMETDASTDKAFKATSTTTTDLTSTTTSSSSSSPTKRIELPTTDDDMSSPKTTSVTQSIPSSSMRNVDCPITALDLDVLTKSPTYNEEDDGH